MEIDSWSDKAFGEPIKKVLINATTEEGKNVVIEVTRKTIDEAPKFKVVSGQLKHKVKVIELQTREIIKQIQRDFKELGHVNWKPDTDLFLRCLHISLAEEKKAITQNLERNLVYMLENGEVFISDKGNVFWLKPDEFFLGPIKCLCNARLNPEERNFFERFIKEQTEDQTGVMMLKATFEFWVE